MSKAEESANRCIHERGYIVIAQNKWCDPPRIPSVVEVTENNGDLGCKVSIISETDVKDWLAQCTFTGRGHEDDAIDEHRYYRAIAE